MAATSLFGNILHGVFNTFVCLRRVFSTGNPELRMEGEVIGPGPYRATKLVSLRKVNCWHEERVYLRKLAENPRHQRKT